MKNCPICGTEVDDRAEFCPICGSQFPGPESGSERETATVDPEKEQLEKEQPEIKQPEIKQPEKEQPEIKQPEIKQPEKEQPEIKQAETKKAVSDPGRSGGGKKVIFALLAVCCILALFLFGRKGGKGGGSAESSTEAFESSEETSEPSADTPEPSAETEEEKVEVPRQREVDRELMNKAYAEVLIDHRVEILSYVNNLKNNINGLDEAQVALYDFNGDGVDELLFVAETDQGRYDLYAYAFDGYKAVPVLQKEVFVEAGGGSEYFVAATSDFILLLIRTIYGEGRKIEARKFGVNKADLTTVYSFDASQGPEEENFSLEENGAGSTQTSSQEIERKVSELVDECRAVLLCNFAYRDEENYSVDDKPRSAMTYGRALSTLGYDLTPETEPDQYYFYDGHTYAFYNAEDLGLNSYAAVADFCRKQNGHLAVINNAEENEYLFDRVKESFVKTTFFGYSDENEEGNWVWAEGNSTYTNWTVEGDWDLPDNGSGYGGDEDYAEFNYERGKEDWVPCDGTWNDAPFRDNTDVFICEWDFEI